MSHALTPLQIEDAKQNWDVDDIKKIPCPQWGRIPPDIESVCDAILPAKRFLRKESKPGDLLLVQGDFGATVNMIGFARLLGLIPVYATTKRMIQERIEGDQIVTTRRFEHVRFREYEETCKGES